MAKEFWKKWIKPWSKEQCERRYIQGSKISVRELSEESGVPAKTIERWCSGGSWKAKRGNYDGRVREKTEEKTVEKISDRLSDQWAELAVHHFEAYKLYRELAEAVGKVFKQTVEQYSHPEVQEELLKKLNPLTVNFWSLVLDRSVKGERQATSMEYLDMNRAIEAIERKTGLKVVAPDDSVIAQHAPSETLQEN